MEDVGYVEQLVSRKASGLMKALQIFCTVLAVLFIFSSLFVLGWSSFTIVILILGIVLAVAAYYFSMNANLEYEYLYCEKELSIDKIMNKSKRKTVGKYSLERMEAVGPMNSYHLDEYKGKNYKELDFSSGVVQQPDKRYVMYYDGREKITLELNEEIVKAMKNGAPRKVFMD